MATNLVVPLLALVPAVVLLQHHRRSLHLLELASVEPPTHHPLDEDHTATKFTLTNFLQQLVICILVRIGKGQDGRGGMGGAELVEIA